MACDEAHAGKEGDLNAEKRYYVVISCDHNGTLWEAGMIPTRIALGNDGAAQRHERAKALFDRISETIGP